MNDVPLPPRLAWPVAACVCIVLMLTCSGCFSAFPTSLTGTPGAQPLVTSGSYSPPAAYDTTASSSGGSCRQGLTSCGGNCVDTGVDIGNCGSCGMACPFNAACRNSQCFCKDGYEWSAADSACVKSTAPAAEVTGSQDQSGGYVCEDPSLTVCGKYCIDLKADPSNCGSCDKACANGEQCSGGQCVSGGQQPPADQQPASQTGGSCEVGTWCPNMCTNPDVDPRNCGACGKSCKDNEACVKGVCSPTICKNQAWSCSGHCAQLNGDMPPLNCGGCGMACPSGQLCYSGICKDFTKEIVGGIPAGYHVCQKYTICPQGTDDPCKASNPPTTFCGWDKTFADGGTPPFLICCKSGETCTNGKCSAIIDLYNIDRTIAKRVPIDPCAGKSGMTNCNGQCYNLQTDNSHCGSCTKICPFQQFCLQGSCTCGTGQIFCGNHCVNANTGSNCGSCGTTCTGGSCTTGVCVCPTGYMNSGGTCTKIASRIVPGNKVLVPIQP